MYCLLLRKKKKKREFSGKRKNLAHTKKNLRFRTKRSDDWSKKFESIETQPFVAELSFNNGRIKFALFSGSVVASSSLFRVLSINSGFAAAEKIKEGFCGHYI